MSVLIQDLLAFSRLLKSENRFRLVPLAEIVNAVCGDFELLVDKKAATISIDDLRVIEAVNLQMNQLFII